MTLSAPYETSISVGSTGVGVGVSLVLVMIRLPNVTQQFCFNDLTLMISYFTFELTKKLTTHDPWIEMIIWPDLINLFGSHDWGNQVVWTSILESFLRSHEKHDTFTMLNMKVGLGCWSLGEGGKWCSPKKWIRLGKDIPRGRHSRRVWTVAFHHYQLVLKMVLVHVRLLLLASFVARSLAFEWNNLFVTMLAQSQLPCTCKGQKALICKTHAFPRLDTRP